MCSLPFNYALCPFRNKEHKQLNPYVHCIKSFLDVSDTLQQCGRRLSVLTTSHKRHLVYRRSLVCPKGLGTKAGKYVSIVDG